MQLWLLAFIDPHGPAHQHSHGWLLRFHSRQGLALVGPDALDRDSLGPGPVGDAIGPLAIHVLDHQQLRQHRWAQSRK